MGTGRQPSASNPYVSRKREVGKLDGGNRHLWSDPIPCLLSGGIREDAAHFCPYAFMACVPFGIVGYSWCLKPQTLFMPHCAVGMRPVGAVFTRTCAAFTGGFLLFVLGSKEKGLPLGVDCGLLWMCSGQKLPRRKFAPGEITGFHGAFALENVSSRQALKSSTNASKVLALSPAKLR